MSEHKFKVGDKVKLVASEYPDGNGGGVFCQYSVGSEFVVEELKGGYLNKTASWNDQTGVFAVAGYRVTGSMLALVKETFPTPKSLLKDFMRVELVSGEIYIVADDAFVREKNCWVGIESYNEDLVDKHDEHPNLDVSKIYDKPTTSNYLIDTSHKGFLVWQRESPEDVAKKNKRFDLTAMLKKLQTEMDEVQKQLEELE